jgi:hypothetical protein
MRIGTAVLIAMLALRVASASETNRSTVSVCVDDSLAGGAEMFIARIAVDEAEILAAQILMTAGVRLDWHGARHCPFEAIQISLHDATPARLMPGALAYARPFDGSSAIMVFLDRVECRANQRHAGPILGHVFAHEIAHILQRIDRHSESGLMKADWTTDDVRKMYVQPLRFSEDDIDLIRLGMSHLTVLTAAK